MLLAFSIARRYDDRIVTARRRESGAFARRVFCTVRGFKPEDSGRVADEGQQDARAESPLSKSCGMQAADSAQQYFWSNWPGLFARDDSSKPPRSTPLDLATVVISSAPVRLF